MMMFSWLVRKSLHPCVCVSELKLNLDIYFRLVRLQQGAYLFRQEPGHLDERTQQKERKDRIYYTLLGTALTFTRKNLS